MDFYPRLLPALPKQLYLKLTEHCLLNHFNVFPFYLLILLSIIFNCKYTPLQMYSGLNRPLWASFETLPLFIKLFQLKQKLQVPND